MEVQSECGEPPADPQPTGKINKAAFKLFGKRRTGSGMAGFFSFRNKGAVSNGNPSSSENGHGSTAAAAAAEPAAPVELVRSKTHDGLPAGPDGPGSGEALGGGGGGRGGGVGGRGVGGSLEAVPVRSLSKSFSFFSFLRRGSLRTAESGGAGLARRGRGLKGLFSSMRWRRGRDRTSEADGGGGVEGAAPADEAQEVEVAQVEQGADITLTLEPLPHRPLEDASDPEPCPHHQTHDSSPGSVSPQFAASADDADADSSSPAFPYTPTDSPLHEPRGPEARAGSGGAASPATPQLERRCGAAADPPSEPSVDRLCSLLFTDVTSLKSFDSLTGCGDIIADTEEEVLSGANGGSGTSSSSSGGGGGNGNGNGNGATGRRTAPASQGSPARRPLPSSQLARSAFSSIASSPPPSLPSRAQISPPQPEHVTGSGVVAYMGGGEEMASPEGVDDADMQGLWHMLPSTGDNSPALLRPHQGATTALSVRDRKTPQVKTLGLSKIPVVGAAGSRSTAKPPPPAAHHHTYGARQPTSPGEKELLSDEGYWDTPTATPTATPVDEGIQRSERIILSRDSCSGDNLYDLYNDPEEEEDKEDDLSSTPSPSTEYKLSPSSQTTPPSSSSSPPSFRSLKGSTSLPRDSKIPLSVRQSPPPPHSVSQSSLPSVLEASAAQPKTQAPPPARTRIPISKVPVRRSGQNKLGNASRGTAHRK